MRTAFCERRKAKITKSKKVKIKRIAAAFAAASLLPTRMCKIKIDLSAASCADISVPWLCHNNNKKKKREPSVSSSYPRTMNFPLLCIYILFRPDFLNTRFHSFVIRWLFLDFISFITVTELAFRTFSLPYANFLVKLVSIIYSYLPPG